MKEYYVVFHRVREHSKSRCTTRNYLTEDEAKKVAENLKQQGFKEVFVETIEYT